MGTDGRWRCCYRNPEWMPGHSKWPDGFARGQWGSWKDAEREAEILRERGLEATIESEQSNPQTMPYVVPS